MMILRAEIVGAENIIACAPSAAVRMTELTGIEAMTIHRLLQWPKRSLENPSTTNLEGRSFARRTLPKW